MVTIKDFEMPKDCDGCPFYTYHSDYEDDCRITGEGLYRVKHGERHEKCPLVILEGLVTSNMKDEIMKIMTEEDKLEVRKYIVESIKSDIDRYREDYELVDCTLIQDLISEYVERIVGEVLADMRPMITERVVNWLRGKNE